MNDQPVYKAGETIQIHGDSILKDYLACVVADLGESVFCVTLGPGTLGGTRTEHKKDEITDANDWQGPWPGQDVYGTEGISRVHREMSRRGLTVGVGVPDPTGS